MRTPLQMTFFTGCVLVKTRLTPLLWVSLGWLFAPVLHSAEAGNVLPVSVLSLTAEAPRTTFRSYGGMTMPGRAADLGFKHGGEIGEVQVDWGDTVVAGDVLARLQPASFEATLNSATADVAVAEAALKAAEADLHIATRTEHRFRDLRSKGHVSIHQYDEVAAVLRSKTAAHGLATAALQRARAQRTGARTALDESRIVAPFAGVIQARLRDEGAQVRPGEPVLRLIGSEAVEARFGLPESSAGVLLPGTDFEVRWQGKPVAASLLALLPEIDPQSRTMSAIFRLNHTTVPPGAVVELRLPHRLDERGYWVPLSSLIEADRGLWSVYVVNGDNIAERHLVEVLHTETAEAFVRGTIKAGDRLVNAGVHRIVPGQVVRIVPIAATDT